MNQYNRGYPYSGCRVRVRNQRKSPSGKEIVDGGYLIHYGIAGQKWGIRRFQNEDGTLTEEGKRRYNESPESDTWKKSEAKHLTDEELRRRNNRLQMEQNYKNLTTKESEREKKQLKQEFKKRVLTAALITPVVAVVGILGKKYISSHADQIGKLISRVGRTTVSKIKSSRATKSMLNFTKNSKYTHPHGSQGMLNYKGDRLNSVKNLFNYRPYKWNQHPRSSAWPSF